MNDDQPRRKRDFEACLRCGAPLDLMGVEEFRTGGTTGGWKLVFGELAELGEGKLQLEVRACTNCRTVDLRVPQTFPDGAQI